MQYFSEKKVQRWVKWTVTVIGLISLLVPMNILRILPETGYLQPLITSIFVFVFTVYMASFTLAKAHEILASAAAYVLYLNIDRALSGGCIQDANPPALEIVTQPS